MTSTATNGTLINRDRKSTGSEPEFVLVSSGEFEIPVENDGTLSLTSIRAQLPGASGLWYWSTDGRRKKAVKFDRTNSKLFPPYGGWSDKTYNVSYSDIFQQGFMSARELERYETATKLFQESVESVSKLTSYDAYVQPLADKDKKFDEMKKENEELKAQLLTAAQVSPGLIYVQNCEKCPLLEESIKVKEMQFAEARGYNVELQTKVEASNETIYELSNKCQEYEKLMMAKSKELDLVKATLEKQKKELELVSGSAGGLLLGKLDSALAEEAKSLRKQLDDSKWRCGELEAALSNKSREAGALYEWRREAENNLNRLNTEHGECFHRREKLEATIHALHQFALLMKREAEHAKKRSGFVDTDGIPEYIGDKYSKDEMAEILQRFEKDLDTTRESLRKQNDELENMKWKCLELEATLAVKENELRFVSEDSLSKEQALLTEIDLLKNELESMKERGNQEEEEEEDSFAEEIIEHSARAGAASATEFRTLEQIVELEEQNAHAGNSEQAAHAGISSDRAAHARINELATTARRAGDREESSILSSSAEYGGYEAGVDDFVDDDEDDV